MFRVLIATFCAVQCYAVPSYGYGGGLGGGYGGGLGYGGYGGGLGGYGGGYGHSINAAIQSHRSVHVVPVPSHYSHSEPTVVNVDTSEQPVVLNFHSRSSPLITHQKHIGLPGSHQSSHSVDEPHVLTHEVTRPVIQEIREIIVPHRNVVQEIKPVLENVQTLVAKGVHGKGGYGGDLGGYGGGLGGYGGGLGGYGGGLGKTMTLGQGLGLGAGLGHGMGSYGGIGLSGGYGYGKGY